MRDGIVPLVTRFMPKRADELVGGSIYWIIKHRSPRGRPILGFDVRASDRRTIIRLDPVLVTVRAWPSAPIRAGAIWPPRMRRRTWARAKPTIWKRCRPTWPGN